MGYSLLEGLAKTAFLVAVGAGFTLASGCGGRTIDVQSDTAANAGSSGALAVDPNTAGTTAAGASQSHGGDPGAEAGFAGVAVGGGSGEGAAAGNGGSNAGGGACNECLPCPFNTIEIYNLGACCPACVPDAVCTNGQAKYAVDSKALLANSALACVSDADCSLLPTATRCGCNYYAVMASEAGVVAEGLSALAKDECSACSLSPTPVICPPAPSAICVDSECMVAYLGLK